jgi:Xaa-Pro aminopeptidase
MTPALSSLEEEPIPAEVRRQRIADLQASARAADLTALVVVSHGVRAELGNHGNLRYLLDWTSWGAPTMLLLPVDDEPIAVVPAPYDKPWMNELCPWIKDVRLENAGAYGRIARELLAERGLRGNIGLIGTRPLDHQVYSELTATNSNWRFLGCDELLQRQRLRKDRYSLARMRRAAAICDAMFEALADALRMPSLPVWKAQAVMNAVAIGEGSETTFNWMVSGKHPDRTRARRAENLASIQPGDTVVASIVLTYAGHYGHTVRMFSIGEPSDECMDVWQSVHDAETSAAASLRPGANARLIPLIAESELFRHFPEAREGDRRRFQPTHFIGLDYIEYPTELTSRPPQHDRSVPDTRALIDYPLEAGMTMEIHPNVQPAGLGLGAVGDIFVVSPTGGQALTSFPTEVQIVRQRR